MHHWVLTFHLYVYGRACKARKSSKYFNMRSYADYQDGYYLQQLLTPNQH